MSAASPPIPTATTSTAAVEDWRPRAATDCLVLPAPGALHVVTPRGSFDLRGGGIDVLHARLAPHLVGERSAAELLAAVPAAQRGAVGAYLARMRAVGALEDAGAPAPARDPLRVLRCLGARRPRLRLRADGARVDVALDAPPRQGPGATSVCLGFATPAEAGALLVQAGRPGRGPRRVTCVVAEDGKATASPDELERRAGVARWLLRTGDARGPGFALRVYRLDQEVGTLTRLLAVDPTRVEEMADLPDRLGILRAVDVDQVPLVVATAAHPLYPHAATAYGLDLTAVRAHLLRAFLLPLLTSPATLGERTAFRAGPVGAPPRCFTPCAPPGEGAVLATAASPAALHLALLEEHAARRMDAHPPAWREVDLLAGNETHPALRYLRDVLRLRRAELRGRVATTADGLTLCSAAGAEGRSFLPTLALARVLLAAAWQEFYGSALPDGGGAPQPALEPAAFASPATLRRTVRRAAASPGCLGLRVSVARLRCWGTVFRAGAPLAAAGEEG
ncbi:MAG TPA: hypothetical protein VFH27_01620 [Longimicrobiaceae bacterium]|nr:hypothetical protein [Longimicrobiaceae bacterium]